MWFCGFKCDILNNMQENLNLSAMLSEAQQTKYKKF